MSARRRVVVLGASGVFGARLCERLAREPAWTLVLAARRAEPLEALRRRLAPEARAELEVAALDRRDAAGLATLRAWAVVDASGPFQGADYAVALNALAAGAHYVDLADARAFVASFGAAVDGTARATGVAAVTGASSSPALAHAALDELTEGWRRIDRVSCAILPGARAPRGPAVMAAALSWTGHPVRVFEGGCWRTRAGWSGLRRPPVPDLGRRWLSLAETADLDLMVERYRPTQAARFEAGLELWPLHLGLWSLGWMGRLGVPLVALGPMLRAGARLFDGMGGDRGGLLAEAEGVDGQGRPARARFTLIAEAGDGPSVPTLPAAAVLRRLAAGAWPEGASVCAGRLSVADILVEADGLAISTRLDRVRPAEPALFPSVLGDGFDALPPAVRAVHAAPGAFEGRATARGSSGLAAGIRRVQGLPPPGRGPCGVAIERTARGERWTRTFTGGRFASVLNAEPGGYGFEEHFGPLTFVFEIERAPAGFRWRAVGWRLGPIGLPLALAPRIRARVSERNGRYRFSVAVAHPLLGLIFAYAGRLARTSP